MSTQGCRPGGLDAPFWGPGQRTPDHPARLLADTSTDRSAGRSDTLASRPASCHTDPRLLSLLSHTERPKPSSVSFRPITAAGLGGCDPAAGLGGLDPAAGLGGCDPVRVWGAVTPRLTYSLLWVWGAVTLLQAWEAMTPRLTRSPLRVWEAVIPCGPPLAPGCKEAPWIPLSSSPADSAESCNEPAALNASFVTSCTRGLDGIP